jgi:hypothetical protein
LCDTLMPLNTLHDPKSPQGQRRGTAAALKLVK